MLIKVEMSLLELFPERRNDRNSVQPSIDKFLVTMIMTRLMHRYQAPNIPLCCPLQCKIVKLAPRFKLLSDKTNKKDAISE